MLEMLRPLAGSNKPGISSGGRPRLWLSASFALAAAVTPTGAAAGSLASKHATPSSLPTRFSGSLAIVVRQSPWSEVDAAVPVKRPARFSGYSATFRFTKVTFAPGKEGPYTFSGTLAPTRFTETEDAPNPQTIAPCKATYTFTSTGTPTGDLGGFALKNGPWQGQLELGVQTTGTVEGDNCGPKLEYTAHQFGVPPRIDVSIGGTAEYNPKKRVLAISTIHDVPTPPARGGRPTSTPAI